MTVVRLEQVDKRFGEQVVLDHVDLEIPSHRLQGLLGRNGAGKTTLINIIAGIVVPDAGTVNVWGRDPARDWRLRRQMGILSEDDICFPELTIREFLWWVGRLRDITEAQVNAEMGRLADGFSLDGRLDCTIRSLSHGMRRKALLVSALLGKPSLLLLDEPTNGLDRQAVEFLRELLVEHRLKGGAAVLASHDWDFVEAVCSHTVLLERGALVPRAQ